MKDSISNSCIRKICKQSINNYAYKKDINLIDKQINERLQANKLINWKAVHSSCRAAISKLIRDYDSYVPYIHRNDRVQMINALLNYFKNKYI